VAALYALRYGRVFSFYQSGSIRPTRDSAPVFVTMGLAIESAIEEGAGEFDMLQASSSTRSTGPTGCARSEVECYRRTCAG